MSTLAGEARPPVEQLNDPTLDEWINKRYKPAVLARQPFEKDWAVAQAFAQGRQWVGWHRTERRIVELPNPHKRERHTTNVIESRVWAVMGKLTLEEFRPNITWRRTDQESQAYARQADRAVSYAWDEELDADMQTADAFLKMLYYGTSAIRVKPERAGPLLGEFPIGPDGQAILDLEQARGYIAQLAERGERAEFEMVREPIIAWEALGPRNILVPPGVHHERYFPWLILERPLPVQKIKDHYPGVADGLTEEKIRSHDQVGLADSQGEPRSSGKLTGHVLLKTGYEFPCGEYPNGRTVVWAKQTRLDVIDSLPLNVDGKPKAGIAFFKYHPVDGQFWAQGLIHPLVGPQRQRNRAGTQRIEMKDRNLGRVYAHKGAITDVNRPKGGIMEHVELRPGSDIPKETAGVPPGPWIEQEVQISDRDMDHIAGLGSPVGTTAPPGTTAYAAFALFAEQEDRRLGPVLKFARATLRELTKVSLEAIRAYWLPQKHIPFTGDDGLMDEFIFNSSNMPQAGLVKIGTGAPLPQSQAAEVQKIFDLFDRSISSGAPLPLDWLFDSLQAGKAQPIPKREGQVQQDKAELENMLLLRGQFAQPAPYDNDELHVQIHTQAEAALALIPNMQGALLAIQQHKMMHLEQARRKSTTVSGPMPGGEQLAPMSDEPRIGDQAQGGGPNQAGFGPLAAALAGGGG